MRLDAGNDDVELSTQPRELQALRFLAPVEAGTIGMVEGDEGVALQGDGSQQLIGRFAFIARVIAN